MLRNMAACKGIRQHVKE